MGCIQRIDKSGAGHAQVKTGCVYRAYAALYLACAIGKTVIRRCGQQYKVYFLRLYACILQRFD